MCAVFDWVVALCVCLSAVCSLRVCVMCVLCYCVSVVPLVSLCCFVIVCLRVVPGCLCV